MSNNNVTLAIPGQSDWAVWWQPQSGLEDFQLDIVGFLAVLGEGSVLANAQVSALSRLFCLPRLLPAPQALIRTSRPTTLPPFTAKVTGVFSGNVKDHVHHVAHILLGESMPTFTVRCVEVTKRLPADLPRRRSTILSRKKTSSPELAAPSVKAKASGPLSWVTILGCLQAIVIFALSVIFGDGFSILATILLGFLSTLVGISNKWNLKLPKRAGTAAPRGDVVIRYPNGSILIVRCNEDVARELYFAPEEIEYSIKSPQIYRLLSLLGTLMLMLGVIALANAKLQLQFVWAGAYIIINIAHWIAAALPQKMHWDMSCYVVREQGVVGGPKNPNFTEALWKAILLTKDTRWVKNGGAAPQTQVWDDWLHEAQERANMYGWHRGPLENPLWTDGNLDQAVIYDGPSPKEWDAKRAWDRLNDEHKVWADPKPSASSQTDSAASIEQEAKIAKTVASVTIV